MTILETIPIMEQAGKYDSIFLLSFIITVVCLFIECTFLKENYGVANVIFVSLFCISAIIVLISFILALTEPETDTGRFKYIVKINDNYSFKDFYDKYKVLEHTKYTDVYTVEELND